MKHLCLSIMVLLCPMFATAYPLDETARTGIERLEGYRLAQQGMVAGNQLTSGALLHSDQIQLHMLENSVLTLPGIDPDLTAKIVRLLGDESDAYSISLLDLTDPAHPRYAAHQDEVPRNPGSIGKLVVLLALFQALADIYPDDIAARERLLRMSMIQADSFIRKDHHLVPFWQPEQMRIVRRRIAEGDRANFWTWLDWMTSASSNAAASMVFKHVMLLRRYGGAYPVSFSDEQAYFDNMPRSRLSEDLRRALNEPLLRNGLDPGQLRQGGFFSREGKRRVPGGSSVSTTRELMRFALLMEQGRLVDQWSSLQMKKLIYLTQRRIRYSSSQALNDAALYFKSGSFYKCEPEPGFSCKQYAGNKLNLMNSLAIIESPAVHPRLNYIVTVTSNVLRKNSAVTQQRLATGLHELMLQLYPDSGSPRHAGPR